MAPIAEELEPLLFCELGHAPLLKLPELDLQLVTEIIAQLRIVSPDCVGDRIHFLEKAPAHWIYDCAFMAPELIGFCAAKIRLPFPAKLSLARTALRQIEAAFEVMRADGHEPNAAYYDALLPEAPARLNQRRRRIEPRRDSPATPLYGS